MTDFISFKLSTVIVCFVHIIVCKWWWEWTLWIQFLLGKSSNTTRKIKFWLIYNFPIAFEKLLFHISLYFSQQVNSKLLMFECTWTTKTQIKGIDVFFSTTSYLVYLACKWRMKKVKLTLMEAHPSGM